MLYNSSSERNADSLVFCRLLRLQVFGWDIARALFLSGLLLEVLGQ